MQKFVELWTYLSASPLFGLTATLVTYLLAQGMYARLGPAVVCLGWPLWQRHVELRRKAPMLLIASVVGTAEQPGGSRRWRRGSPSSPAWLAL